MPGERLGTGVEALVVLADPVRQRLYDYVVDSALDVSRDGAARALGISRPLAAFHLEKLAAAGLLETRFARVSGRSGPGAGRPAKLYRRAGRRFELTLPPRRHELLARVLSSAAATGGDAAIDALVEAAYQTGREIGAAARPAGERGKAGLLGRAQTVLEQQGFEPFREGSGRIRLRNCPFDPASREWPQVVCRANLSLVRGMLEGLGARGIRPELQPPDGTCCVVVDRATAHPSESATG